MNVFHTISNFKLQQKLNCRQNNWRRASSDENLNERRAPGLNANLFFVITQMYGEKRLEKCEDLKKNSRINSENDEKSKWKT